MISKIKIKNFRSIKSLEFFPNLMVSFIGRNNVGKSNIIEAIKLLLTEKWPPYALHDEDIYNHDMSLRGTIELYFSSQIKYVYYGKEFLIGGFKLEFKICKWWGN